MAKLLGIRVIHCSEIDTQIPKTNSYTEPFGENFDIEKNKDKLLNTWSCLGLIDEGIEPFEVTLGTHENVEKILDKFHKSNFFEQHLVVDKPGYLTKFKSVVPSKINADKTIMFEEFVGRSVHHGESISLNRFLSDETYSPTIHYVYKVSPLTDKYLESKTSKQLVNQGQTEAHIGWHVMNMYDDKIDGYDNIGALFILEKNPMTLNNEPFMFWTGSILNTEYTKTELNDKYFGPTSIQVMAGVLSGLSYIVENKELGLMYGEDVPEDYIIEKCKKFLGIFYCGKINEKINLDYHMENLLLSN
jgi:homospermidine synthase